MGESDEKAECKRRLDWLMDRAEIEDVLASYARGIDRGDAEVLRTVYHVGARDEHGIFSGPATEFIDFIVPRTCAANLTMQHHFTTVSIDIRGIEAGVESYFICIMFGTDRSLEYFGGRCIDRFEKRDSFWAITHRQVLMDWTERRSQIELPEMDGMFLKGTFGDRDPSFSIVPDLRLGGFFRTRSVINLIR